MTPQNTPVQKKTYPTKAEVKRKVKAAKALLKADPKMTQKGLCEHVGLAPMTLAKYLKPKKRTVKVSAPKSSGIKSLIEELGNAEARLAQAKKNLREALSV